MLFTVFDQGRGLPTGGKGGGEDVPRISATRGPSASTMATMTTRTVAMTVEIDANGLRVRDEFRIMFLVYDRARRHAS